MMSEIGKRDDWQERMTIFITPPFISALFLLWHAGQGVPRVLLGLAIVNFDFPCLRDTDFKLSLQGP
jgi:hypothetical protein